MAAVGGSISEVSLAGRIFPVAADAEAQRKFGGFENEVQSNGDGTARMIKTRVPLSLTGLTIEIDDSQEDGEFLQSLANATDYFALSITYASGVTYMATAMITGEMQISSQSQTASVDLMGPGELKKQ
jgi:hypothetical protein